MSKIIYESHRFIHAFSNFKEVAFNNKMGNAFFTLQDILFEVINHSFWCMLLHDLIKN